MSKSSYKIIESDSARFIVRFEQLICSLTVSTKDARPAGQLLKMTYLILSLFLEKKKFLFVEMLKYCFGYFCVQKNFVLVIKFYVPFRFVRILMYATFQ